MPDLHDSLENEARRVRSEPGALGAVLERAGRRRRTRRIASGVLALAVAGGGIGLAYAAFRPTRDLRPGGPLPGPTTSVSPDPVAFEGLSIGNRSSQEGAAEFARALLASEGVAADLMLLRAQEGNSEATTIHSHSSRQADAVSLRDRFFPDAELVSRIDPGSETLLVAIGNDFLHEHEREFELFMTVRSFMTRRVEGAGAEAFLSDDAADQYADGQNGLSLYGYTQGGGFQIQVFHRGEDEAAVVELVTWAPPAADDFVLERLTVGDHDPEDGRPEILAAELTGPQGPAYEEVRPFVRGFLKARRLASGAGTYLGEDARDAYASHEDGLDLLRYAASEDLRFSRIVQYDKLSPDRHRVVVLFVLSRPAAGEFEPERIHEVLTIEPLDEGFVVADAERRFSG